MTALAERNTMRIAILESGHVAPEIVGIHGTYPKMLRAALGPSYGYLEFDVTRGELPGSYAVADAYLITGSITSAYEDVAWVSDLQKWLAGIDPATPIVGMCFGHQILAQTHGGVVRKSEKGVGIGLHRYSVSSREPWMDDAREFVLPVVHFDQVVDVPRAARVIATSEFCPVAALAYDDRRVITFQAHPEFTSDFVAALIERGIRIGKVGNEVARAARATLAQPHDASRVIGWIRKFLEH